VTTREEPAPAIVLDGASYRASKRFFEGTHRICAPEETLDRVRPHFPSMGITRIADITGLDRLPVSTVLAMRPNSRTLANGSGKGFTKAAAAASAVMETIEHHHAEHPEFEVTVASYAELAAGSDMIRVEDLPLTRDNVFSVDNDEQWVRGWDLVNGRPAMVPMLLAMMATRHDGSRWNSFSFQMGSNGLASGNHILEAVLAGLYECIERDATTSYKVVGSRLGVPPPRVELAAIKHPDPAELIGRLRSVDVRTTLYDCTIDTAVPTFLATIEDATGALGRYTGYGTHLDPSIAMIRAITEAVQARAVYVAGSRDDLFDHARFLIHEGKAMGPLHRGEGPIVEIDGLTSEATLSFEQDIMIVVEKLRRAGLEQVIVVDLTNPRFGEIPVVKVIVPGCEGYAFPFYKPGWRADALCRTISEAER
jgi:ribosomal protein S12 methylthiotransferase accessory factor